MPPTIWSSQRVIPNEPGLLNFLLESRKGALAPLASQASDGVAAPGSSAAINLGGCWKRTEIGSPRNVSSAGASGPPRKMSSKMQRASARSTSVREHVSASKTTCFWQRRYEAQPRNMAGSVSYEVEAPKLLTSATNACSMASASKRSRQRAAALVASSLPKRG